MNISGKLYNRCMWDDSWLPNTLYALVTWFNRLKAGKLTLPRTTWMKRRRSLNVYHRQELDWELRLEMADLARKAEREDQYCKHLEGL